MRTELVRAWSRFDTDLFGKEVVAHISEENIYFPVSNLRELRALHSFGGRSRIKVSGEFTTVDFVNSCRSDRLTHLWVEANMGGTWGWLHNFPNLRSLTIETLMPRIDVSSLAQVLSLRTIRVPEAAVVIGRDRLPPSMEVVRERLSGI